MISRLPDVFLFGHTFTYSDIYIPCVQISKSTFINALVGEQSIDTGTIEPGETVAFGKYDQMGIPFLNPEQSVLDFVKERVESSTPGMSMAEAPSEAMKLVSVVFGARRYSLLICILKGSHLLFSASL